MKFTDTHEWIELSKDNPAKDDIGTVGVTQFAQKELGEIVYVELPQVGKEVKMGQEAAVLESTKAAADIYAPISGTITAVNTQLSSQPELVNNSPEKAGWLFKIRPNNPAEWDTLLDTRAQ